MSKQDRTIPAREIFARFSPERQQKIRARAVELIAEEMATPARAARVKKKPAASTRKKSTAKKSARA